MSPTQRSCTDDECGSEEEILEKLLRSRLKGNDSDSWYIGKSAFGGRGIFASRNLEPGQLIFVDVPIVIGPRWNADGAACCTCFGCDRPLAACQGECRLPLCESCQGNHSQTECQLLTARLRVKKSSSWSPELYRALAPLRCLAITDPVERKIINFLQANPTPTPEISLVKANIENDLCKEDENWMTRCCNVMDSVAFEVILAPKHQRTPPSMRGLYPLAGMLNHSCVPNTRNYSAGEQKLSFVTSLPVTKGEELFTSYCPTLWGSYLRNQFLSKTKQFICSCIRCLNPTEMGSYLSALGCPCGGVLMPNDCRNAKTLWSCNQCDQSISAAQASLASALLAGGRRVPFGVTLPESNHIKVQMRISSLFKSSQELNGMHKEDLEDRLNKITEILEIFNKICLGECRTRGLLYFELFNTLNHLEEISEVNPSERKDMYFSNAKQILEHDLSIPKHVKMEFNKDCN